MIEGWYSGIPAIATTAIGFAEYWTEPLGELIPFNNENQLKDAMQTVKRRIENGFYSRDYIRDYATKYFSEQAVYNRLKEIYTE